ncbi:hypothetical protein UFOVP1130_16 [uncultured Caudovirales phage]|uniref:Uncharacterized protein n=1 Tax=uncultured Caudovirales phage TaxID=2100421 RepID=A0A6J5QW81_9CAUD|nr:hypothetical protein UFOVP1130_16 [uncultured Caudovirales phage]
MSEDTENKCCECDEFVDSEGDYGWSNVKEDYLCLGCRESDESSVSTVQVVDAGVTKKYYIGNHVRMTEDGDDLYNTNLTIDRTWVSSSEWRGHYETTIEGWTDVMNGWTTGGWDDPIARRKATFNQWADSVLTGEIEPPVAVAIVADPTSNVFSMGISVLTPEPTTFKEWLDTEFDELYEALS